MLLRPEAGLYLRSSQWTTKREGGWELGSTVPGRRLDVELRPSGQSLFITHHGYIVSGQSMEGPGKERNLGHLSGQKEPSVWLLETHCLSGRQGVSATSVTPISESERQDRRAQRRGEVGRGGP